MNFLKLRDEAERGSSNAQFLLGREILEKNLKGTTQEGISWYKLAAHQGHLEASVNLGVLYQTGYHVKKDLSAGFEWHLKAAKLGHLESCLNVGLSYAKGRGVLKSEVLAYMWLHIGITSKDWAVELFLDESTDYEDTPLNILIVNAWKYKEIKYKKLNQYKKGQAQLTWFKLGNDSGPLDCLLAYGYCLQEDTERLGNHEEAAKIFRRITEYAWTHGSKDYCGFSKFDFKQYYSAAWHALGDCYKSGLGVNKSISEAQKCYDESLYIQKSRGHWRPGHEEDKEDEDNIEEEAGTSL
jgi:TPR repeat protein